MISITNSITYFSKQINNIKYVNDKYNFYFKKKDKIR